MEGFEVTVAGASGALTAWSAVLSRPVTARMSPHRAAPTGLAAGVAGLTLGAIGFAADVWPLLLPASVLLGTGSGVLMTSGLAITTEIAQDERQGALTTAFYAFAYLGMLVPMAVTTIGRVWSSSAGLIIVTTAAGLTGLVLTMTVREPPRPAIST